MGLYKYLKRKQIFWDLAYWSFKKLPISHFMGLPDEIIMEMSAACNLRCPMCPTHFAMSRPKGFMDKALFTAVIDEFSIVKKKPRISMDFAGEPLLNPVISEMVEYAENSGHRTYISTNATLLTEELSIYLIKAGLSSIHLCLDGFDAKSHEAYRVGSNFELVKKNIEKFLEIRKDLGCETPHVVIQTLITSMSEPKMKEIEAWAKNIGAEAINFKSFSLGAFTTDDLKNRYRHMLPQNEEYRRKNSSLQKKVCRVPTYQAVVYWNGDLGICCIDFNASVKMPNIKEKGFIKTILSKEVRAIRRKAFMKSYPLCQRCDMNNADFMGFNVGLKK